MLKCTQLVRPVAPPMRPDIRVLSGCSNSCTTTMSLFRLAKWLFHLFLSYSTVIFLYLSRYSWAASKLVVLVWVGKLLVWVWVWVEGFPSLEIGYEENLEKPVALYSLCRVQRSLWCTLKYGEIPESESFLVVQPLGGLGPSRGRRLYSARKLKFPILMLFLFPCKLD